MTELTRNAAAGLFKTSFLAGVVVTFGPLLAGLRTCLVVDSVDFPRACFAETFRRNRGAMHGVYTTKAAVK